MNEITQYQNNDIIVEKLNKARDKAIKLRSSKTSKEQVKWRDGKAGQRWKYITRAQAEAELDKHYPGWSYEAMDYKELFDRVHVLGRLTVIDENVGKRIIQRWGSKEIIKKKDGSIATATDYIKSAESDSIKRCTIGFGLFNDVYTDEDFEGNISRTNELLVPLLIDYIESNNYKPQVLTNLINKMMTNSVTEDLINAFKNKIGD